MDKGAAYFAKSDGLVIIKLTGEVRFPLGPALDSFLDRLFGKSDFQDILIDLTETQMIDSTCLGLLAKIANEIHDRFQRRATIFSLYDDVNRILEGVGFTEVFNIVQGGPQIAGEMEKLVAANPNHDHLAKTLYESHRILSELNEKNRAAFQNILETLRDRDRI
jgi:anti-anti-sigma factor